MSAITPLPPGVRPVSNRSSCLHHLRRVERGRLAAFDLVREGEDWNFRPLGQSWFSTAIADAVPFVFPSAEGLVEVARDGEPRILESTREEEVDVLEGRRPLPFARTCFEVILPDHPWFRINNVAEYRVCLLAERGPFSDPSDPSWMSGPNGITFAHFHAMRTFQGDWRGVYNGVAGHLGVATDGEPGYTYISVFDAPRAPEQYWVDAARGLLERILSELAAPATERVLVPGPDRLNASRRKKRQPNIPDRYVVHVRRRVSDEGDPITDGNTSPRTHMRRSHVRRLANGQEVTVRECIVNASAGGGIGPVQYRVLGARAE